MHIPLSTRNPSPELHGRPANPGHADGPEPAAAVAAAEIRCGKGMHSSEWEGGTWSYLICAASANFYIREILSNTCQEGGSRKHWGAQR